MHELLDGISGEMMELDAYYADFEKNFWSITDLGFWKLERQQVFKEPDYDSWVAFAKGDWDEALRILEAGRADMENYHRRIEEHGFITARARVVEEPITPYLQWELHALRVRDQCGGSVRIVRPEHIEGFEEEAPLPEIYTLGSKVMYQAIYNEESVLESVRKYVDFDLIKRCQRFIQDLYDVAEPLKHYFPRRVAALPAPRPQ
jgi:hypothetical protein